MVEEKKRKYILFNSEDGRTGPKPCAFFESAAGCRNGDKCKFSHGGAPSAISMPAPQPVEAPPSPVPAANPIKPSTGKKAKAAPVSLQQTFDVLNNLPTSSPMMVTPMHPKRTVESSTAKRKAREDEMEEDSQFLFGAVNEALKGGLQPSPANNGYNMGASDMIPGGSSGKKKPPRPSRNTNNNSNAGANGFLDPNDVIQRLATTNTVRTAKPAPVVSAPQQLYQDSNVVNSNPGFGFSGLPIANPFVQSNTNATNTIMNKAKPQAKKEPVVPTVGINIPNSLQALILKTRSHPRYASEYAFENRDHTWVETKPYGAWCQEAKYPTIIGIDCEMCETTDPVSNTKDPSALIRLSVVNGSTASNNFPVLLDTLVNPLMPITDIRSNIHGIAENQLHTVQFTLRHAQAALLSMCSDNCIIVGHSLHNDLKSLKFTHSKALYIDTSYAFDIENEAGKSPSLRDIAMFVNNTNLSANRQHDSIQDAQIAVQAVYYLIEQQKLVSGGLNRSVASMLKDATPSVTRSSHGLTHPANQCLLVHRIPGSYTADDVKNMFVTCTYVVPSSVPPITHGNLSEGEAPADSSAGKTIVVFASEEHANLAFETLTGPNRPDKNNKAQKRVYLKSGGHICVRKY